MPERLKFCLKCHGVKPQTAFSVWYRGGDGLDNHCKDCRSTYYRDYYQKTIERRRFKRNDRHNRIKEEMIAAYGGSCSCCGESESKFLSIDHVNGGGNHERKRLKLSGTMLYDRLRKLGWPKGEFTVLCFNCNLSKGFFGACPHASKKMEAA